MVELRKTLLIGLILLFFIYGLSKFLQYTNTKEAINRYLTEQDYQKDIVSKEIRYDFKLGCFYMVVYYDNYPDREYEYFRHHNAIKGTASEKGVEIDTEEYLLHASY